MMKRRGDVENEGSFTENFLSSPTIVTVFILKLMVVFINCCLVVVSTQQYYGETILSNLLEWLQNLDGVEMRMNQHIFRRPELLNMITRKFLVPIITIADWCSVYYVGCLVFLLTSQCLVFSLTGKKWYELARFSGTSLNCFLWSILLLKSFQRTRSVCLDVLLSCVTCVISWYLLLTSPLGTRLFGRKKKKKIKKKLELRACANEELPSDTEIPENGARKFKLPMELEFAEENHNLDENISSLSLGPVDCGQERKQVTGSWFDNNLSTKSFQPDLSFEKLSLIWPAKLQLNECHLRKKEHGMSEFSDDESALEPHMRKRKTSKGELERGSHQNGDVSRTTTLSTRWRCNVLCLILFISLALNACFLWLLKDTIRKAIFRM